MCRTCWNEIFFLFLLAFGGVLGLVLCRLLMLNGLEFPGKGEREQPQREIELELEKEEREVLFFRLRKN